MRLSPLRAAIAALFAGLVILAALPLQGFAGLPLTDQLAAKVDVKKVVDQTVSTVQSVVSRATHTSSAPSSSQTKESQASKEKAKTTKAKTRASDPTVDPPLHGTAPHGQGSVAAVDLAPDNHRPTGSDPAGKDTGEDIVVGRAKGSMNGTQPHGHITILALFGMEILGVDTGPGQTVAGPLNALQQALLDPICSGSGNNACVSAVRADSATTSSGSTNKFSTAHATLGGPAGLDVGAAESNGNISNDPQCQTSSASSSVANVNAAGQAVASLAQSSTTSKACQNQPPSQQTSSSVLGLGGTAVPLPAAGCGNGTPDTQTGIPALLPIVCNGDDSGQAALPNAVREALTVFALAAGSSSVARIGTGSSESVAVAPAAATTPPGNTNGSGNNGNNNNNNNGNNGSGESSKAQCADGIDNDGDGKIDAADPGCHSDGNPNNPASYDRHDNSEQDDNGNNGGTQCADGVDNDGDGKIDARDPGCHTDGNANNPASYNPADNSEGPNAGAGNNNAASSLPFTGSNVLLTLIAGLLLLAAGLSVRRSQAARQR